MTRRTFLALMAGVVASTSRPWRALARKRRSARVDASAIAMHVVIPGPSLPAPLPMGTFVKLPWTVVALTPNVGARRRAAQSRVSVAL